MSEGIKSGLSFTQTLDNFSASQGGNQRIDVLEDGSLGERISKSSGTVQYWEQLGGSFTPEESLQHASATSTIIRHGGRASHEFADWQEIAA